MSAGNGSELGLTYADGTRLSAIAKRAEQRRVWSWGVLTTRLIFRDCHARGVLKHGFTPDRWRSGSGIEATLKLRRLVKRVRYAQIEQWSQDLYTLAELRSWDDKYGYAAF
mmetsp:Transcript_35425/g.89481  ORF Transcript_35425/g.89481 Transcript_35425/m.89481 type:complete len:111 (-) Transcript_35425:677-1009(-)